MLIRQELSPTQLELLRLFSTPVQKYDDEGNKLPSVALGRRILDAKALQEINSEPHKVSIKKCNMTKRILARVETMQSPYFTTITMDDKTLNEKDFTRNIKRLFKVLHIYNWVLITDYGKKHKRLHFHGYIDLVGVNQDEIIATPTKKYPFGLQLKRFSKNIGFNLLTPIERSKKSLQQTINYTLKYIVKGGTTDFDHKMFCSRRTKENIFEDLPF